jgi:hypothetical protein
MVEEELLNFEHKRELLASLIRVAQDLNGHTHALHDVQLLAKPSQTFPSRVTHYKDELSPSVREMDDTDIKNRSGRYDTQTVHLLDALLEFIDIVQHQVTVDEEPSEFSDEARAQLDEFKQVSHTAVALRILLQDHGLFLPAVKFGFPQEWIGEQISALNHTNHSLREKSKDRIAELIIEAEALLASKSLALATKDALSYAQHAMMLDLEFLEHGGNIEKLPYDFEELEINALPKDTVNTFIEENKIPTLDDIVKDPSNEETNQATKSFNNKLKLWLNTPWKTRWRDLD